MQAVRVETVESRATLPDIDHRHPFRVGPWEVRPIAGELAGPGGVIHLEPKVMDVLVVLARHSPGVVERELLIREVWGERAISDDPLSKCIATLRRAFGDSAKAPDYIQTYPKRGYSLIAPVGEGAVRHGPETAADAGDRSAVEAWPYPQDWDGLKILRRLGSGSMGTVHLAQEPALGRLVAVKTLHAGLASDDRAQSRFEREARAAARILHPNVAAVYRVGQLPDGAPFIVQQFVPGHTLAELLAMAEDLSEERIVSIVAQLAAALAAAHVKGIIHRDVKPGNVMIDADSGTAVLTDFGIAGLQETGDHIATQLTRHDEVLGDPRYISPEQAQGDPITAASDVYSLGVLACEVATGRVVERCPPPTQQQRYPDVDLPASEQLAAVNRAIRHSLAIHPGDRPTAQQIVDWIGNSNAADGITVPDFSDTESAPRPRRLSRQQLAVAAIAIALAATGALYAIVA